jgi:hypothetical protein
MTTVHDADVIKYSVKSVEAPIRAACMHRTTRARRYEAAAVDQSYHGKADSNRTTSHAL